MSTGTLPFPLRSRPVRFFSLYYHLHCPRSLTAGPTTCTYPPGSVHFYPCHRQFFFFLCRPSVLFLCPQSVSPSVFFLFLFFFSSARSLLFFLVPRYLFLVIHFVFFTSAQFSVHRPLYPRNSVPFSSLPSASFSFLYPDATLYPQFSFFFLFSSSPRSALYPRHFVPSVPLCTVRLLCIFLFCFDPFSFLPFSRPIFCFFAIAQFFFCFLPFLASFFVSFFCRPVPRVHILFRSRVSLSTCI
jgi:hypothetical protein